MSCTCSRCLLSEDVPGLLVDADGICSVCREYDRKWGDWNERRAERLVALNGVLDWARGKKRPYDVLVPLSGGKDSTYVLYICRERFGLRCLAVTWDNGFLTEHARENIKNAVDLLGVDHLYYGISSQLLIRLYRHFFLETGFFCPVCMRGIRVAVERAASAFGVSLVITGTSSRTEEYIAPEFFQGGGLRFFKAVLKGCPLEREAEVLMYGDDWTRRMERVLTSYSEIALPDYLDWNYDEIFRIISNELGWRAPVLDAEHADCKANNIVDYFRYIKFPALVPEMLRFSKLVTAGQMTKKEALRRVAENRAAVAEPDNLDWFLDTLEVSREQLDKLVADPLRHMKYIEEPGRLWRILRTLKHWLLGAALGWRSPLKSY